LKASILGLARESANVVQDGILRRIVNPPSASEYRVARQPRTRVLNGAVADSWLGCFPPGSKLGCESLNTLNHSNCGTPFPRTDRFPFVSKIPIAELPDFTTQLES
jgi:hypothetical protein